MIKAIRSYLETMRGDQKNINITIKAPNQINNTIVSDATLPKVAFDSFSKKPTSIETWMPQVPTITNSMRQLPEMDMTEFNKQVLKLKSDRD